MSTTIPNALKPGYDVRVKAIYDAYVEALGDSDKATSIMDASYYNGLVDGYLSALAIFDALEDETWRETYPEKPEWWDDDTEPRCDVCGVHTEEAGVYVKNPDVNLDRYPGAWCGECGNCADHCTCDARPASSAAETENPFADLTDEQIEDRIQALTDEARRRENLLFIESGGNWS